MQFHDVDMKQRLKTMRELAPDAYRAFLEFDTKAFKDGAVSVKTKELVALGIAHVTQCPWCIDAHAGRATKAGASPAEIAEVTFVAMAMAAGAAWSHGALALESLERHRTSHGAGG
jgi:AhpD family alkylhydroperoxidase